MERPYEALGATAALGQPLPPKRLAFLLGGSSPDAGALICLQRVLETVVDHRADMTDGLGLLYRTLVETVGGGEEERIGMAGAGGTGSPVRSQLGRELCWP